MFTTIRAESRDHFAMLKVHLSGNINGKNFYRTCCAMRKNVHGSAGGLLGHAVGALVSAAMTATMDRAVSQDPKFIQCLAECLAVMHESIDRAAGVEQSALAKKWHLLQFVGKVLFFGSFIAAIPVVVQLFNHQHRVVGLSISVFAVSLFGLVMGSSLYFLVWAACLLFFPDKFYSEEPVGRRVLARTGLQTPYQVRAAVLAVFAAMVGLVACVGWFSGIE